MGRGSPPLPISPFLCACDARATRFEVRPKGGGRRLADHADDGALPSGGGRAMACSCRWRRWPWRAAARPSVRFRASTAGSPRSTPTRPARERQYRLADRRHPAQSERSGRLQHARHRLRQERALSRTRSQISPRRSSSIRISPPPTPIARSPIGRPRRTAPALADFNSADRRQPQRRRGLSRTRQSACARRAISPRRWPISTQAIRLNPEGAQAYHARGLIYQRQGNHAQAITDFNNAIDRDPFAAAPYQARGQSLLATGKYDAAIEDFNAALNVDANNADAWAGLGLAYEKQGNKSKAVESYQRAMQVSPSNPIARAGLQRLA